MFLPKHPSPGPASGLSLVELTLVLAILTVAVGMLSTTLANVGRLGPTHRESARALEAARNAVETLRATDFDEVFARFNDDPNDDPDGPGTAPGADFAVQQLDPDPADADGWVGRIVLPTAAGELREDLVDPLLGMPRDLNGDGVQDALNHAADYAILPICVQLRWRGHNGPRTFEQYTALVRP